MSFVSNLEDPVSQRYKYKVSPKKTTFVVVMADAITLPDIRTAIGLNGFNIMPGGSVSSNCVE
jgi:hypothetical protein